MKRRIIIALIPTLFLLATGAAQAAEQGPNCIDTTRLRNTTVPNDTTILFHMNDGKVWQNHLRNYCSGLRMYGFAYEATPPHDLCGNVQSIRVLRTGAICMLGSFEPWRAADRHEVQGGNP